ncbi:MAG TPA: ABC transporter substrate-binding protein [Candidatus Ventrousia excrementavium]|uniref:ABC transporter substrate-binding protein n=1 Tax=Candidatus Ventrousia excrementavium TaxID=2840961 RepID=A0A9D1IVK0_9CLOT|nr:ABC transporter substrate-binding protein [Candidatus Ventrousia excrementavium]
MKRLLALLLALCMLFALAACGGGGETTSPDDTSQNPDDPPGDTPDDSDAAPVDNVVRMGRDMASVGNLNSLLTTYNSIFEVSDCVFDQLIRKNPYTLELEPNLIVDFPEISNDGTLFTFELKQGVKFHDGTELTAKDVQYTFSRFFDPDSGNLNGWMANMIKGSQDMIDSGTNGQIDTLESVVVIDDYHFSIELEYGYTAFLAVLAVAPLNIVPMDACEAAGDRWGIDTLIGTGPFKLESFNPNNEIVLVRNDDYHGEVVQLDGVEILNMDANTALIEWEAGTIDVCSVSTSLVDGYLDNPDYADNVQFTEYIGIHCLNFNQDLEPFDDQRVRLAVGLATDIQSLCDGYFQGHIKPAKSLIPKGVLGYDDSLPELEYDPERAKELLADAGYPDGITITATMTEGSDWDKIYQVLQEQYKLANITLEIEKVDSAGWLDKRSTGNVQFYMMNWYADFVDPDNFLYSLYHSSVATFFSNGMNDPEWDAKLDAGRLITDLDEKQEYYADLEYWLSREHVAEWPLYAPAGYTLVSDRVHEVFCKSDFLMSFTEGYIEE